MWFFKRKKANPESIPAGLPCSYCKSTRTRVIDSSGSDQPGSIKTWRGRRYLTCTCLDCGRNFYADEPPEGITDNLLLDDGFIDDEEELHAAEEELRRQIEEEDDRRYR